ncbi:hypothetical protein J5N97_008306 [Dioscorea zingiberensis]|uniref:Uncharacterized protein n=1 Tax=Dioscorea zingiberensis TaxID=325984 RepID=A0A9D5DGN1_9LILI|nr:hypothetical protein J5N97_008306 [Dioscorea zingiberensis]
MEGLLEEEVWRCRKHPSVTPFGVCPFCLRDRLRLLCPDCAQARPCECAATAAAPSISSSSSSSFSSFSSIDLVRSSSVSAIGAVGRVSNLIDSEQAFGRSRSVAIPFARRRAVAGDPAKRGWVAALWPFRVKSKSVAADGAKGWGWHFPSPMKALRHLKTARVTLERSPVRR